ncbi:MAG: hypothetical protein C0433_11885 [Cyclobacterium sp.]|nr:hypothetical protein [Cyclobacterium sp.]
MDVRLLGGINLSLLPHILVLMSKEYALPQNLKIVFDLFIQGVDSNLKAEILKYKGGDKIDISTLPKGDYILLILYKGKVIHQDRLVVSK